ncbi:protein sprouty homolog 2-like [Asterias rubens]|uniref:protein sprouty homolog 2-like n=1 Tax=Asterias rubens TaxID=7604 RepID=UPI001455418C|nr:protein sprouty homolog 2-like [Asterias rubens]
MAQDGNGVISRQPRSLTRSLRQSSGRQPIGQQPRIVDFPALQSAPPERRAPGNEYVYEPGNELLNNTRNNNDNPAQPHLLSGSHHHRNNRSTFIVVSDNGKTKVLKYAKREVSRTSEESDSSAQTTTPLRCYDSNIPIACQACGKCCCDKCRTRTDFPQTWLCGRYKCSAENTLEYCTCLFCVKGLFYHFADSNHDDYSWGDKPCSCGDKKCCMRWSIMGMISLVLPCLWCYLPGRGCISSCKLCFARDGCKCKESEYETL